MGRLTAERRAASLQRTVGKIALSWFYSGCRWHAEKSLEIQANIAYISSIKADILIFISETGKVS